MENYNWSKFTVRIPVKAGVQRVYDNLSTKSGLESWFLRLAEFSKPLKQPWTLTSIIEKGDQYKWFWHGYNDDTAETGNFTDANGHDKIQFTFAGKCLVTITIKRKGDLSLVELVQEHIPLDEKSKVQYHLGCLQGWTFYLANLKSILEGGVDLRNKDLELKGVLNS
jgi:uncharacterized protein YndB with AHSA1/START domain